MSNILLIVRKKIIYIPHQWCQLKPENQRKRLRGFVECQVNRQIKGRQSSDLEATFHLRERLLEVPPKKTQKNPTTETLVFRCQKRGRPVLFFFVFWSCGICCVFFCLGRRDLGFGVVGFLFIYKEMKMRLEGFFLWMIFERYFASLIYDLMRCFYDATWNHLGQRLGTHHLPQRPKVI